MQVKSRNQENKKKREDMKSKTKMNNRIMKASSKTVNSGLGFTNVLV